MFWGDEMGERSDQAAGRSFSCRGVAPVDRRTGRRFGFNVIQAITNRGELFFRVFLECFTGSVLLDFLERLLKHAGGRRLILIVDGYPARVARPVKAWATQNSRLLELGVSSTCPATAPS